MGQTIGPTVSLWNQFGVANENVHCLKQNLFVFGKKLMIRQQLPAQSLPHISFDHQHGHWMMVWRIKVKAGQN